MLILVVDDDEDTREAIREALLSEHFEVAEAAQGEDALELLRAGMRPDVILLDMKMPNMCGSEFRARQLEQPSFAAVPIIVISAVAEIDLDWAGQDPTVLRKPFRLDELVAAIDRLTRKQSGLHVRPGKGAAARKVGEAERRDQERHTGAGPPRDASVSERPSTSKRAGARGTSGR